MAKSNRPAATRANRALHELTSNRYYSAIPLDRIYDIVEGVGFEFDAEEKQCMLCGREGTASWDLSWRGQPMNHVLIVSWYKMEATGRYEVNAYVS